MEINNMNRIFKDFNYDSLYECFIELFRIERTQGLFFESFPLEDYRNRINDFSLELIHNGLSLIVEGCLEPIFIFYFDYHINRFISKNDITDFAVGEICMTKTLLLLLYYGHREDFDFMCYQFSKEFNKMARNLKEE